MLACASTARTSRNAEASPGNLDSGQRFLTLHYKIARLAACESTP
jgi:hypothetical protein